MQAMASSLFHVLRFPHQGKIVTVEQLSLFTSSSSDGNVPFVEHTSIPYESVGARLFKDPALMGVFSLPPPNISPIRMISVRSDPWILPPTNQIESWGDVMPLSPTELNYVEIIYASASFSEPTTSGRALDSYV